MKQILHLSGIGEIPINVAEASETSFHLSGRQALALLRILHCHSTAIEQQAQAERDQEFGCGPGAYAAEVPRKITNGDDRLGKQVVSLTNTYQRSLTGEVTAILRYSNGIEQIEITRKIFAQDSDKPGTEVVWVHADDVDLLSDGENR